MCDNCDCQQTEGQRLTQRLERMEYWAMEYQRRWNAASDLLKRLREWGVLDTQNDGGDGAFWKREIDKVMQLAVGAGPSPEMLASKQVEAERGRILDKADEWRKKGMISENEYGAICAVVLVDDRELTQSEKDFALTLDINMPPKVIGE